MPNIKWLGVVVAINLVATIVTPVRADQFFATTVIDPNPATAASLRALGGPRGAGLIFGGTDVDTLGVGGHLTLGFDGAIAVGGLPQRAITNGTGPDFIVFENAFYAGGDPTLAFAELMFVEVSSDGTHFARFPVVSDTTLPQGQTTLGEFDTINASDVSGFAGVHPVLANVGDGTSAHPSNGISPFDPNFAGGDVFDLSSLTSTVLQQQGELGLVDTNAIRYVRLVDVVGDGNSLDQNGHKIYDAFGASNNGADVDAISVINGVTLPEPATLSALVCVAMICRRRGR